MRNRPTGPTTATPVESYGQAAADLITEDVAAIAAFERASLEHRSPAELLADLVTRSAGTAAFVLVHVARFGAWILVSVGAMPTAQVARRGSRGESAGGRRSIDFDWPRP